MKNQEATKTKSSFSTTHEKLAALKAKANDRGMSLSDLIDHHIALGPFLERRVEQGKEFYAIDKNNEKEALPITEFLACYKGNNDGNY